MNKDEALKMALDDLIAEYHMETSSFAKRVDEIFKQALAAQHEPENEPFVSLASVQEPVAWMFDCGNGGRMYAEDLDASVGWLPLYTTPPAAQRQWVGLSQDELDAMFSNTIKGKKLVNYVARAIEAKLREKNAAAQPAVPDAMTSADIQEHIEYVAGWNECRQAMLEMMK
jgi:Mg2+ and Co2+ transporter CorA